MVCLSRAWALVLYDRRHASSESLFGASRIGFDNVRKLFGNKRGFKEQAAKHHQKHRIQYHHRSILDFLLEMPGPVRKSFMRNWWAVEVRSVLLKNSRPEQCAGDTSLILACHLRPFQCERCHRNSTYAHPRNITSILQFRRRGRHRRRLHMVPHPPRARPQW